MSTAGTSEGGNSKPRFPGADFSKIRPSLWRVWRAAFLILSATFVPQNSFSNRHGESFANGTGEPFDFLAPGRLRYTDQAAFSELRVMRAQRQRPDNFVAQQLRVDHAHGARELHYKFVEDRPLEDAADAGQFFELGQGKLRLGNILLGHFPQAQLAQQTEVHGGSERAKGLIGANI